MKNIEKVTVIGGGLAGVEAAYQLAKRGVSVDLFEMRPKKNTEAHNTDLFAELVCSNSLRANSVENAVGLLKEEMRRLDSIILTAADRFSVPAGGALAVDRTLFSEFLTNEIKNNPLITVHLEEVETLPEGNVIVASGPLTSPHLSEDIKSRLGVEHLHFFDAAAPIVSKESIDFTKAYYKSRYDKGTADYINCPMTREEYELFYKELTTAETVILKDFELKVFEGCMPVEIMAKRGIQTLLFGPMKPVGLAQDMNNKPYAVVQLRQDNAVGDLYNVVGFQTNLKFPEQKRVLRLVPGLENVEIVRYGVMHRNTFINSPKILKNSYQLRDRENLFFAGQMTGVEGYVESAASGLVAGINMAKLLNEEEIKAFPDNTMIGAMANYVSNPAIENFQPMNANFGILPSLGFKHKKKERKMLYAERALKEIDDFRTNY